MNTLLVGAGYWGKNFIRILNKDDNDFNLKYIFDTITSSLNTETLVKSRNSK